VVEPLELNPRQPHVFLVLKPELPKVHKVEVKPVELKPIFQQTEIILTSNQPTRPKDEVKVANLSPASPAPATVAAPANKVQTGGFGDPNGIPGPGNPSKAPNMNQAGSPSLPGGPGSGNGSGGAQGTRGTVASDGSKMSSHATGGTTTSVDILYEPNPAYSNEARILKMEGDVVLEVVFLASGRMQVTRVVSGLGYGLDEAAIQAAKQIRFRPAKRNGQPVDFPAHVRIEFRLSK
jgi:TonB family protein